MRLADMDDLFESAWLKWAWAVVDAHVLQDTLNELAIQADLQVPLGMETDYDAKRHCIVIRVYAFESPFPKLWGLLLGDTVHNLRSSLDHLAWALYKRGHTPNLSDKRERKVYFPITTTRTIFNDALKTKLPGARRADIAIVRRCQPYKRGKKYLNRHVLFVLDELARADKHRTIQPVVPVPESSFFKIAGRQDCVIRRFKPALGRVLEPGAELGRFYVKKTGPDPDIEVNPRFTLSPCVNHRLTVEEFLGRTISATAHLLREFAPMPDSARGVLGDIPTP